MEVERRRKVSLNPFSPWRSTPDNLNRTIVGRDHIIKDILDKTQRFCQGAPPKHCLLIGRRGLGKTHILALLYHYYENNCIINGFETISSDVLPVILLEEERYSLNSLAIFLIKIFNKFCEKMPEEAKWRIPENLESDEDVINYCLETLKKISESEKKNIIVLCDNLEDIFKQWSDRQYKTLRSFLSDQQTIMIIGTAVKIFNQIISPDQPFYEFFETIHLRDLSDSQMLELLKKRFIEDHLEEEFNRKEKYLKNKIAAIAKLTGGNPRLVVFLYDIVTKKNVFEIENATEELMESLSEYFRNRFSALAPQEKTILDAFADMEGPATPKEISKKTRIKENSTNAHIKKLKQEGFIDTVEYGKHKITRYDVTERLFRLWRQTATISGRRKYHILIKFLKLYFTPEEIKEDFQRSLKQLDSAFLKNKSEGIEIHIHYLSYLQHAAEGSLKYEIFDKRTDFLFKIGDYEKVGKEIQSFKSEMEVEKADYDLKPVYKKLVKTHLQQEKYAEASKDIVQILEYPISERKDEYIEILDKIIDECPDDDQAWYSKGIILAKADEYEEALKYFEKASELKPKEPKYFFEKAFSLRNLNRLEEALPLIEKAIKLNEKDARYWAEKGIISTLSGKDQQAMQYFQKASELKPEEPEYYRLQAFSLRNLNRLEKALPMIEKAIDLNGNNAIYWEEKGTIVGTSRKHEEALHAFQNASKLDPEQPEYYRLQAVALHKLNRLEEASLLIEKAIKLDIDNSDYWKEKGIILNNSGKHEEALGCFGKASDLAPENPEYHYQKTVALRNLNRLSEALPVIGKAIELDGNNARYWGEKGTILGNLGKHEDALKCFGKASDLEPEEPEYHYKQAIALRNLDRLEEALKSIEKASQLAKDQPEYFYYHAYLLRNLNRLKEAIPMIEKTIELDGNNASYWEERGRIIGTMGELEKALQSFRKASELKPDEADYYRLQAHIFCNLNRLKEALPLTGKEIELAKNNADYWKEKGIIIDNMGKFKEASQVLPEASELEPKYPEYYYLEANVFRNLNRLKEALTLIEKAIELDMNNDSYWVEKGLIQTTLGNHERAFKAFQKASELEPKQTEYYRLQAFALRNLNRLQEALQVIEKAVELDEKNLSLREEKARILAETGKYKEARQCFQKSIKLNPEDIDHKIRFLGFLVFDIKDMEEAGNYLKEIEKTSHDQIKDNLIYLHFKSEYLILTCHFEDAISLSEKRLKKEPYDLDAKLSYLINKACLGEFGEHMEGLAGKIANEKLVEFQIKEVTQFIFRIMETCLSKGDNQTANGLYLTLLKLKEWHHIDAVQNSIALYIRQLVDLKNRDLFVQAVNSARELISDKNLLELLKAFIYAARYLQEGNKVILEEVFPEIREIIFDMIEKFESRED